MSPASAGKKDGGVKVMAVRFFDMPVARGKVIPHRTEVKIRDIPTLLEEIDVKDRDRIHQDFILTKNNENQPIFPETGTAFIA